MLPESFDSEIPTFTDSKICQQKESASSKNLTDCLVYVIKNYEMYHTEG